MSFCVGALALSGPNRDDLYASSPLLRCGLRTAGNIVGSSTVPFAFHMLREATRPLIKCR